jgi:hypothetical protein
MSNKESMGMCFTLKNPTGERAFMNFVLIKGKDTRTC